ncbi:MAG: hypothetical protein HYY06_33255 [Deltaproteobacteria bacterium]|nr:hypothetical protein [Deltaproteobacteria bacterium]
MSYDSTNWAFRSGADLYYMFVERQTGAIACGRWFDATDSQGSENPRGQIPQFTYTVIHNGTYNPTTKLVSYAGNNYRFRLQRDLSAGKQVSAAIAV